MQGSGRILIVEDHADSRQLLARLLEAAGYTVCECDSMATAVAACEREIFPVAIIDLGLPDGDGIQLLQAINGHRPTKSIALTGNNDPEIVRSCMEAGFCRHVLKPIEVELLLEMIQEYGPLAESGCR